MIADLTDLKDGSQLSGSQLLNSVSEAIKNLESEAGKKEVLSPQATPASSMSGASLHRTIWLVLQCLIKLLKDISHLFYDTALDMEIKFIQDTPLD
jgi:hypothetical protein